MTNEPPELFLIDGNSLVYRAFFALPEEIATSTGFPTNAILGFASMLVKILGEHGAKPTLVVWDAGSSGRKELYDDYKGHRPSQPDLLRQQYPHMRPLVDAFGYGNVEVEGYEADDVIATLAQRAAGEGVRVTIVTGDRDALQLVDDAVSVMATSRGITETKLYDREAVIERYGVGPELVADLVGLKGDASDNIPGIPGIGDKTAAALLGQFGTLEAVLDHADEVSGPKRRQALIDHAEIARLSKRLATARRDVPIELDPIAEAARQPDRSRLREVFREFELREPLRRLEEALGESDGETTVPAARAETVLRARVRAGGLDALAGLGEGPVALAALVGDQPQDQLFADDAPMRFGAYAGGGEVLVGECPNAAALVEAAGGRPVIAHDAKAFGIVAPVLAHDTLVAAYLLDPARRGFPLAELAEDRGLACEIPKHPEAVDALLTHELAGAQRALLEQRGLMDLFERVELPLVVVLRAMELAGLRLDTARLARIAGRVRDDLHALEREIYRLAGTEFHIGSPQQLAEVLFNRLGLSRKRRGKTGYSTDARVLAAIRDEHEIIPAIERYRELSKLLQTYLDALPALINPNDGRLHTTFNQASTATGRLSSTNPNLQNIPIRTALGREIRGCFVAEPGNVLISADYSQVELRVLAHVAGEPVLKEIFAGGEDVHTATAAEIFRVDPAELDAGLRSKAKMVNFGIVYGLSAFGLADRLQIPQEEAQEFIERYLARFPAVRRYIAETIATATEEGYVSTLLGRRRIIPELKARQRQVRQLGERLAVNTPIQGSAADIIKLAMVRCHDALAGAGLRTRLILQIHDELLFEAPAGEREPAQTIVRREMESAFALDPPLAVDVGAGPSWMEAKA